MQKTSSGTLRALPSYTADFLRRRDDSRDMLGRAFQDLPQGTIKTIKTSIRLVTWQLPTMAKLVKWGNSAHGEVG